MKKGKKRATKNDGNEKKEEKKEDKIEEKKEEEKVEDPNTTSSLIEEGTLSLELLDASEDRTFRAGNLIKLAIKLDLTKTLTLKDFRVELKGYLKALWSDTVGPKRTKKYEVHKIILDMEEEIKTAKPSNDGSVTFGVGFYRLPAKFALPEIVMSSFEGDRGFIRYYISVRGKSEDKPILLHLQRILIVAPLDLSQDPKYLVPLRFIENQDVVMCWCYGGKIRGRLQLDRRGYIPGEFITVTGMITNCSKKRMKFTKCSLTLKVTYIKDNWKYKARKKLLAFIKHGPTKPGEVDYWEDAQLKVPSHMPPVLLNCKYIQIKYILKVQVEMAFSFPSKHTLFNVLVTVGHVSPVPPEDKEGEKEEEGKDGDDLIVLKL